MEHLASWLKKLKESGSHRELRPLERCGGGRLRLTGQSASSRPFLDFSSNDYLALSGHPEVIAASRHFLEKTGAGSGAARLMSGDLELHHQLEEKTARIKGKEAALVFGSGYLANIGVIPALAGRHDVIFTDRLNHASIYDGCRLSGAKVVRFRHNDLNHLEDCLKTNRGTGQALIVVESIYSMDGDSCPLKELIRLKKRFSCLLMVDEAHATGIFGKNGGGMIEEVGVADRVDIAMGTFGKALGSYGAYIASSNEVINFLINKARTFIYSTALPPAVIGASLAAMDIIRKDPSLRHELHRKTVLFKQHLKEGGFQDDLGPSQIIPIRVGDSKKALDLVADMRAHHIFATAIRPPTVPAGTARIRLSITRHHTDKDLKKTAVIVNNVLRHHPPSNDLNLRQLGHNITKRLSF